MVNIIGNISSRISAVKPVPEYEDVLGALSDEGMTSFKAKLNSLGDALSKASEEPDPVTACETLRAQFGQDFPVPEPRGVAKKTTAPAIVTSSSSA